MNILKPRRLITLTVLLAAAIGVSSHAAVSAAEAAKLGGTELTPVGAQQAGTADGRIPAWNGSDAQLMAKLAE